MTGQRLPHSRLILSLLMGLALFAQSLIPAGFMPAASIGEGYTIVICSGFEQKTITVAGDNKAGGPYDEDGGPCAFSVAPVAANLHSPAMPALIAVTVPAEQGPVLSDFIAVYPSRSHFPTGPPLLV